MTLDVYDLRAEYRSDSRFVSTPKPRISWKCKTTARAWVQAGAELRWTCGELERRAAIDSNESVFVAWPFDALKTGDQGVLSVRVTGEDGERSDWSEPLEIASGFRAESRWDTEMVELPEPTRSGQPMMARCEFVARPGLVSATLYSTAHGVYQAQINGIAVDQELLKPGWTSYQYRLVHETNDIAPLLHEGANAIGVTIAGGWFTEKFGFFGSAKEFYGEHVAFSAELELRYADGSADTLTTSDERWRVTSDGPLVSSGIYAGEIYDARRALPGWSTAGFDDSRWLVPHRRPLEVVPEPRIAPPVRAIEEIPVVRVIRSPTNRTILDFGQNLVGHVRFTVKGASGDRVVLRHAEVLEDGELGVRPLREAEATDTYILTGDGPETWEPAFTFHGFRYTQIDGWPGELRPSDFVAVVIHSDMQRTGGFACSDAAVSRLHQNVVWSMRGNFLSLPTDCPQRDERMGWTGDIQVFAPTATQLYDCDGFLASWLADLACEQAGGGGVPHVVPDVLRSADVPAAGWGDAATTVPFVLWQSYADRAVLEQQYSSMKAWVDQISAVAGQSRLWKGGFQFGDWLDPDAPPERPGQAKTDPDLVSTAYLARSSGIVSAAAKELGYDEDARFYQQLSDETRAAWVKEYVTPSGRIVSDSPTAYGLAIVFSLVTEPAMLAAMGGRLASLVRRGGYRIRTGFLGTPLLQDALTKTDHLDTASRLLFQTDSPSWLYPVTMGATTIWERWDSMLEDGSINPGEMTSFNHYALGAIADWLHRVVAGLGAAEPGYKVLKVAPVPINGLDWAEATLDCPYGPARVEWAVSGPSITVKASVPPNTRADVCLPGQEPFQVGSGEHEWQFDDQRGAETLKSLTLESSLADIIDDPEAHAAVLAAIDSVDPLQAQDVRAFTSWIPEQTLAGEIKIRSAELVEVVKAALEELAARRMASADRNGSRVAVHEQAG